MGRLRINDGYTLPASTDAETVCDGIEYKSLEVVNYEYRPALPEAVFEWQTALARSVSGKEQADANAKLIADHVTSWDIVDVGVKPERTADVCAGNARVIPHPISNQMIRKIITWQGRQMGQDAGN